MLTPAEVWHRHEFITAFKVSERAPKWPSVFSFGMTNPNPMPLVPSISLSDKSSMASKNSTNISSMVSCCRCSSCRFRNKAEKKILKHRKWLRENVQLFPTVSSSNTNLLAGLVMAKLCFVKCPIVPGLSFELHLHQEWFGIGSFCELFRSRRLTGSWVPGGMGWAKKMFNLVITDRKFIFRISLWMAYWYQKKRWCYPMK